MSRLWLVVHLISVAPLYSSCIDVAFSREGSPGVLVYDAARDDSLGLSARFPCSMGTSIPAVLCPATTPGRAITGSVILLAEWFGVSEATLAVAHSLNAAGMDSYVLNVYRDHHLPVDFTFTSVATVSAAQRDSAHKMRTLSWQALASDVAVVARNISSTTGHSVALLGLSEGAALALLASQRSAAHLVAVVSFYGSPGSKFTGEAAALFDPSKVDIPVHLACGSLDSFLNFSSCMSLRALKATLIGAPLVEVLEYPKVGHGFLNGMPWWSAWKRAQVPPREPYQPEVVAHALEQAATFLRGQLLKHTATQRAAPAFHATPESSHAPPTTGETAGRV